MNEVLINDKLFSREQAVVDIEDRGYQFGDGIYEMIGVYNGKSFLMDEHLERLKRSADEIGLNLPYELKEIKNKLEKLKSNNNVKEGTIYIQVTRGVAPRDHSFPRPATSAQLIAFTKNMERPVFIQKNGVKAVLSNDIRWLRCDIKSLNLLPNVLAKQKAKENNAYETILSRDGVVTEGSSTNVFIVKENKIQTHPATNLILNGITRRKVLELCRNLELTVDEKYYSTKQLLNADEVFLTGTKIDVVPVIEIDGHKIADGKVGNITKKIQRAFDAVIDNIDN